MKSSLFGILLLAVMFSCREKKQVDVKPPTIESFTVNGSSDSDITLSASSQLNITYTVKDNMGLDQSSFNIHPANDGHVHTGDGSQGGEDRLTSGNWTYQESIPLAGLSYAGNVQIQIPDSIAGTWHLEVTTKDDVGRTASRAVSLHVTNSNLPIISNTSATPVISNDGYIYASVGSSINLVTMVNDPDNLAGVAVRLISSTTGATLNHIDIPVSGTTTTFPTTFNHSIAGEYLIVIDATDMRGYHSVWDVRVKVQ